MTEDDKIGADAVVIANQIEALCHGRQSASVFLALSMIIGHFAAQGAKPDFHGTIRLIQAGAFDTFRQTMRERRNG
jgi:hypothetical protein